MRFFGLTLLLAASFPAAAFAGQATIVSRDVPLTGSRALAAAKAPARFNLVGLHWRGAGTVQFRTHSLEGRWGEWVDAAPESEDQPDLRTRERARTGPWRIGNPWWVGPSNRIEYRLRGRVSRLRAFFVWSPSAAVPLRSLQTAGSPGVVSRAGWGADEAIKRAAPSFAPEVRVAIVHHTAGSNGYTPAESAAIVRGIQIYHVKGNGWNDIGYNFLVDKYGKVFEGRYGGIDRNVVGAHAEGFNTGSVGAAVLGEYSSLSVTAKARESLAQLLAWRLDLAHVEPISSLSFISGGNARFPSGLPVFLRGVSGHRDTGFTDCPGSALYSLLGAIAGDVSEIGLPKLYAPVVTGTVPGKVRFRARLSSAQDWTIDVTDDKGLNVMSTGGFGQSIDWSWDASSLAAGGYSYAIRALDVTPALGRIGGGATAGLAVTGVAADPETITPNEDGAADASTITYTLSAPATVTVTVRDDFGTEVARLSRAWRRAAEHAFGFDGLELPDGIYHVHIDAQATGGRTASALVQVAITRTLGSFTVARQAFSPNGDGRADRIAFSFALGSAAEVRLRVLRAGKWISTPFEGPMAAGARRIEWNGAKRIGRLRDGDYEAVVEATDAVATATLALPFASDTRAPQVRILRRAPLKVWVSEPARLTIRAGGRSLKRDVGLGEARIAAPRLGLVRVVAWDAAGNKSVPVSKR
ncbi:MAG: N-acetylmuramoyl-L-alanine amidase [Actinobacteria bacterium]|nr:N-acetylmuramoyl-L-alanine amidase [Actinomycetota bacterium]